MTDSLRLTRQDIPVIALSTVASVSLAAIFWVTAHHPIAPPALASRPPAVQHSHFHHARTLPVVHPSQSTPPPAFQVVVQRQTVPTTTTTAHRPFPSTSPSPQPAPGPSGLCVGALALVKVCVPLGGQ